MKVSFLDAPSLVSKLPDLMLDCTQLDIAMAYVKIGGLRTLLRNAAPLIQQKVKIRIVFGLSSRQGITDKESAELLLDLAQNKHVIVKKLNNAGFHPKMLIFHGHHTKIVVGSSNLTEAAHSTNAEANVLVEEANSLFVEEALNFFETHFNGAPYLEKKHVDAYAPKSYENYGNTSYQTWKEDKLNSPSATKKQLERLHPDVIWKIAPGANARHWPEWLQNIDEDGEGFVAIGWDEAGDLNDFKTYDALEQAVRNTAETVWDPQSERKTNVRYATDQLWAFKTAFTVGDIIIVYSESRVLGVAQVTPTSKYRYREVPTISYGYQMNVKYLWYAKWPPRADDRIVDTLGKQGTLKRIDENGFWAYLAKRLS